jgi:hypothetical protein
MGEPKIYTFNHKEVAEALVKQQGIHEGLWGLYIEFGITAGNVGQDATSLMPAAIVPVQKIGIQQFPEENNLCVDAAKVNPGSDRKPSSDKRRR